MLSNSYTNPRREAVRLAQRAAAKRNAPHDDPITGAVTDAHAHHFALPRVREDETCEQKRARAYGIESDAERRAREAK